MSGGSPARREPVSAIHSTAPHAMTDPFLSNVTPLAQFGEQSMRFPPYPLPPDQITLPVVQAIKASVSSGLKPGWHTATITFKLNEEGGLTLIDEYKVSSFGDDKP